MSCWKTCQVSLVEDSNGYSGPWPKAGTMQNGTVSERPMSEPRTEGRDGSSWPTPAARDYRPANGSECLKEKDRPHLSQLPNFVATWPTPTAGDAKSAGSRNGKDSKANMGVSLTDKVRTGDSLGRQGRERLPKHSRPVLNPAFVEALMGFPIGWTACAPLETESFQQWLRLHSAVSCGDCTP